MQFKLLSDDAAGLKDAILAHEDMIVEKVRGKLVLAQNDDLTDLIFEEEQTVQDVRFLLRLLKL
jgi:hypothetical protein